ncbi:MAG: rod shape-determining protein MreC [Oscillospiraceae bacterium]
MNDFIKSPKFKILVAIFIALFVSLMLSLKNPIVSPLMEQIMGVILTPIQKVTSNLSHTVTSFFSNIIHIKDIIQENDSIKQENIELKKQMIDYDDIKTENARYENFLGLKELNEDFDIQPAAVVGRAPNERFGSFTIDKGSLHGVSAYDPVINKEGLVGYISEVALTHSKVITLIDIDIDISAYISKTKEPGMISGDIELVQKGYTKLSYISKGSNASVGDFVVTSGSGGIYPKGILIGEIVAIESDIGGISTYAIVKPVADIADIIDVAVIKDFVGQHKQN